MTESVLTESWLAEARGNAQRLAAQRQLVDPKLFPASVRAITEVPRDWLELVAGEPVPDRVRAPLWVRLLVLRASREDVVYLTWRAGQGAKDAVARMASLAASLAATANRRPIRIEGE